MFVNRLQKAMKITKKILLTMTISLFIFLVISFLIPLIKFKTTNISKNINTKEIKIIGHRGASGLAPENTSASFNKAIEIGVDIIELDIHLSSDNQLIVMHDSNIKRTTNGTGEIENLTLAEIKKLDAGSWYDEKYRTEKVPTLNEVFELVNNQCKIMIEIKWPKQGVYRGIVEKLIQAIENHKLEQQVIVQSFESKYIEKVISINPKIECHQLIFGESSFFPIYYDRKLRFGKFKPLENIKSVNCFYPFLSETTKNATQTGVFTVNTKDDMLKVATLGANYVITDYPNIAIEVLH